MPDPLPYAKLSDLDQARAERVKVEPGYLAELLNTAAVPSFSPQTAEWLLERVLPPLDHAIGALEQMNAAEAEEASREALALLRTYRSSIELILRVAVFQQRAVLDELQRHLRVVHAQEFGIAPENADQLEDLLLLKAFAEIGKKS